MSNSALPDKRLWEQVKHLSFDKSAGKKHAADDAYKQQVIGILKAVRNLFVHNKPLPMSVFEDILSKHTEVVKKQKESQ